jgi:Helicase conserved C-terminal domain/SNF2-related domain
MASRRRSSSAPGGDVGQADLFSVDPSATTMHALDGRHWPSGARFPFNRAGARVRDHVRPDLLGSPHPLVVAGYASVAALVDLVADWAAHDGRDAGGGQVRLLLGAEPFPTMRRSFASSQVAFTEEVRTYWEEKGISLRLSAKVLSAIQLIDDRRFVARYVHGQTGLHAKIYAGAEAATLGSSNFTDAGLVSQLEANARFSRAEEPGRFHELWTIAEHLWDIGQPWNVELRALLEHLLRVVSWDEALAQACADLLEGQWARRYLDDAGHGGATLWPSQRAGIAQALWITENVGSALIADATGSGKTRMGAHLVRAVRDRMWSTGRARRDLAVVVCPPAVEQTWRREAITAGVNIQTISHGLLSRGGGEVPRVEQDAVRGSQILAVDESHNFLNRDSNRTRQLRDSQPDHVLLFTATPINRGPSDLLQLVGLLGADNFEDETLDVLRRLDRRRGNDQVLSAAEVDLLRREIQRFTVRRTKTLLNELVDREPDAYADPLTARVCRYPRHDASTYVTGESAGDEAVADAIRAITADLVGIAQLERAIAVPVGLRAEYTDDRWLAFRLASVRGLAAHHVLGAMRSSRAALIEHLAGTAAASEQFGLTKFKTASTGDVIAKLRALGAEGPPAVGLSCELPAWLTDAAEWAQRCDAERARYTEMLALAGRLGAARERAKADVLLELTRRHERILAFDRHPITLEQLRVVIAEASSGAVRVIVATGSTPNERRQVEVAFARSSSERAIALCSDAMNEGLNLQGASAVVHLDLPTTLRVAEQRIGRVDRMDSPYDAIEALWPRDGRSFATRANELLAQRAAESAQLLGSNLPVPDLRALTERPAGEEALGEVVDVQERIAEAEAPGAETWDGIRDALDPVRQLVSGPTPLVPGDVYEAARTGETRAAARLSLVASSTPWAFLAVAAGAHGAPRWLLLRGGSLGAGRSLTGTSDLSEVTNGLRSLLRDDPPGRALDDDALEFMNRALDAAAAMELELLPRRSRRGLEQLARITRRWALAARTAGLEHDAQRWSALGDLGGAERRAPEILGPDPQLVAEQWTSLVRPALDGYRRTHRHQPFVVLRDLDETLARNPLDLVEVERAFAALPRLASLAERVTACILGVPEPARLLDPPLAPPTPLGGLARSRYGSR